MSPAVGLSWGGGPPGPPSAPPRTLLGMDCHTCLCYGTNQNPRPPAEVPASRTAGCCPPRRRKVSPPPGLSSPVPGHSPTQAATVTAPILHAMAVVRLFGFLLFCEF